MYINSYIYIVNKAIKVNITYKSHLQNIQDTQLSHLTTSKFNIY